MEPLKIIPLGGLGEFGLNMMLLECGGAAIAIDCGLMFPGADLLGIDLVIPDVSYLLENKQNLKGIVLTHAHEDHIGALPYILKHLSVPIFGTRLTLGLLDNKLREHHLEDTADIREITAGQLWELAPFQLEGIRVTHSLMDCLALAIETPVGTVIHTGDFKIDNTPMEGEMFDFQRFAAYGEKGVLLLLSDSTNVERAGYTPSEREVGTNLEQIFQGTTGSQGEPLSVLHRVALDDHKSIKVESGDTVILSSKFIPGNEKTISNLINHLYRGGAEVHYEKVSEIHVSGHASQEELKTMLQLTRPRYFVPIHGEYRHLIRHRRLAQDVG